MLLSAVSVLVVAQSSSEIPEGLMNNPVYNVRKVQFFFRQKATPWAGLHSERATIMIIGTHNLLITVEFL